MRLSARILVATDSTTDADLVRKLLAYEFDNVSISTDPDRSVEDFEQRRPDVLVLAFNELERAERYYLGLYRRGTMVHALQHRTVILCNKDSVRRVYELCRKEYFDDYVLFWPMTHDAPRLAMTVHHALRQMEASRAAPSNAAGLVTQARRIAELEGQLEQYVARGQQQVNEASHSLHTAGSEIDAALDHFEKQLASGELRHLVEVKDSLGLESEVARLKVQQIDPWFRAAAKAVTSVGDWADGFKEALRPQIESARSMKSLSEQLRPVVLIVEDDPFHTRLLTGALDSLKAELVCAASGAEALGALRKRRPDLVLMDFELPDISGVEVTRRMKAVPQFADTPVVMITSHSAKQVVVESLQAGATDFIVKPFDRATLIAKAQKLLVERD